MVAISLYRGNLHRVPDVPRRWLTPTPKISLKDFKTLLSRRNRALSCLRSTATTVTLNPNSYSKLQAETEKPNGLSLLQPKLETDKAGDCQEEGGNVDEIEEIEDQQKLDGGDGQEEGGNVDKIEEIEDQQKLDGGDCLVKPVDEAKVAEDKAVDAVDGDGKLQSSEIIEKPAERPHLAERSEQANLNEQTSDKVQMQDDKEKRKKEIEEKLETLNAKKHNLVQALKQLLNAEEELKRRNSMQGMATCPSGTLQGDVINDSGLMTRHTTPRTGSEANLGGDTEGAEAEDASNQYAHSRHMLRMSSRSPSSESPLRRPTYFQHNAVPYPSRASLGVTGSPSRFAPTGHQGNSGNLPAVSVSGTNYIASSPSPAASGGTSVFRDARQPSPWN